MENRMSFKFTTEMTFKAIELRSKYNNEFKGEKFATKEIWKKIANEMGFEDISMGAKVLAKKWDNLLQKYKRMKIGRNSDGQRSDNQIEKTPESWVYFQKMDELLGQKHNIVPPIVMTSIDIQDNDNDSQNPTININPYDIQAIIQHQQSPHDYVIPIDGSDKRSRKRTVQEESFRQRKRKREEIDNKMSRLIDESMEVMKSLGESMQQTSSAVCSLVNLLSKLIDKTNNSQNEDDLFL